MRSISISILVILLLPCLGHTATRSPVTLPWSSSFGNSAATITYDASEENVVDNLFTLENQSLPSYLSVAANHSGGTGSMGYRVPLTDGDNAASGVSLGITFATPQPEFWMRFYIRYPTGFRWSQFEYHKWVYFGDNGTADMRDWNSILFQPASGGAYRIISMPNNTSYYGDASPTWYDTFADGGTASTGNWHYVEFHVKMDTNSANGIAEYWIDGVKHMTVTNANFSGGDTAARQGWTLFRFNTNQAFPGNAGGIGSPSYVDYDDVAISATGYIGPIGGDSTSPAISLTSIGGSGSYGSLAIAVLRMALPVIYGQGVSGQHGNTSAMGLGAASGTYRHANIIMH